MNTMIIDATCIGYAVIGMSEVSSLLAFQITNRHAIMGVAGQSMIGTPALSSQLNATWTLAGTLATTEIGMLRSGIGINGTMATGWAGSFVPPTRPIGLAVVLG